MDEHSEPVAAAAAYDLVISDESDVAMYDPHIREIDKDTLVSTALPTISTTQSMENVLLDTLPVDESIDLGSESVLDQSVHSVSSASRLDEEATHEADDSSVSVKTEQITLPDEQSHVDDSVKDGVHFDDIMSPSDEIENEPSAEDLLVENKETLNGSSEVDTVTVQLTEADSQFGRIVTFSEERSSECDDAYEVEFVEEKGLQPAESSRSLCKFFENEDNVGGTDVEGKSFFDSFTTGNEDPITPSVIPSPKVLEPASTLPPLSLPHVSLSSSFSSAGATPSPVRRISDSSPFPAQHQNSVNEGSMSEADPFSAGMFTNDVDRRHDAWIPSESTRLILVSVLTNAAGTPLPTHCTCNPHIIVDESLGDPVHDMVERLLGEQEAAKRLVLTADSVPQDEIGLRQLIKVECLRAGMELTRRLLTQCGQGINTSSQPAQHTVCSLQLWFCRLSLMIKLHLFSSAETEMEQFSDLDSPDLYHEYYTSSSGSMRRGSMVPFDMRMLHAELPQHVGRLHDSVDRLCHLRTVISQMLTNLENGLAEDGSMIQLNDTSFRASKELWHDRENRVLYALGNCLLNAKNYAAALQIYTQLVDEDEPNKANLLSGIGRIYLQMGNVNVTSKYFELAESIDASSSLNLLNRGLLQLANSNFADAYEQFKKLTELDSTNVVAVNNLAVCSLYLGRLKEALQHLETLVHRDPAGNLHEGVVLNLCTLYELESSRAVSKKQALLGLVALHKGDGFNVACLKLS